MGIDERRDHSFRVPRPGSLRGDRRARRLHRLPRGPRRGLGGGGDRNALPRRHLARPAFRHGARGRALVAGGAGGRPSGARVRPRGPGDRAGHGARSLEARGLAGGGRGGGTACATPTRSCARRRRRSSGRGRPRRGSRLCRPPCATRCGWFGSRPPALCSTRWRRSHRPGRRPARSDDRMAGGAVDPRPTSPRRISRSAAPRSQCATGRARSPASARR